MLYDWIDADVQALQRAAGIIFSIAAAFHGFSSFVSMVTVNVEVMFLSTHIGLAKIL